MSFFFYNKWPKFYDELVNLAIVTSFSSESMTINFFEYSSSGRQAGVQWPMHHNSSQEPLLPPSPLLPSPLPPLCHHHNNHQHQYNQPPIFITASFPLISLLLFLCSRIFWREKNYSSPSLSIFSASSNHSFILQAFLDLLSILEI